MSAYDLSGKVALVTGAARGIGFETARQLHLRGASVVLVDLNAVETEEAARRIGERAVGVGADVTDPDQIEAAVARAVEAFGGLDVAVANAGIAPETGSTRAIGADEWERVIDVNLLGVWRTVRAAMPQVVERRGHLVLVASVYAFMNGVLLSSYATAKAGVESLGRSLRTELAPYGAGASVAYFGYIDTRMVQEGFAHPIAKRLEEEMLPGLARGRLHPEAAGRAIVEGIEERRPRIVAPSWWRVLSALRGLVNPLLDRQLVANEEVAAIIRDADREAFAAGEAPAAVQAAGGPADPDRVPSADAAS